MIPAFGLSMLLSLALCVHVVRTGQQMYWLMIILIVQPFGAIVYLIAIVLPSLSGGVSARRFVTALHVRLYSGAGTSP